MSGPLPATGAPTIIWGLIGVPLIALGALFVKIARKGAQSAQKAG